MGYGERFEQKTIEQIGTDRVNFDLNPALPAHARQTLHLVGRPLLASRGVADNPSRSGAACRPPIHPAKADQGLVRGGELVWRRIRRAEDGQRSGL